MRSTEAKLSRAAEQLSDLVQWAQSSAANPITFKAELLEDRKLARITVVEVPLYTSLTSIGVKTGEYVHNLRTSLDNMAFDLARLREDPPPDPRGIFFPIFANKGEFERYSSRSLRQMPDEVASVIASVQPFHRDNPDVEGSPGSDPLMLLQKLNNLDKHRTPSVLLFPPRQIAFLHGVQFFSEADAAANVPPAITINTEPLRPGMMVLEHRTTAPIKEVNGALSATALTALRLDGQNLPFEPTLRQLNAYTNLVVEQFRRFS